MAVARELRAAVRERGFGRLYATRLAGQTADGVFQVGLAGFVLFTPERQATAADVAAALAVLLVPFSLIGPFAGVLIDRWRRQRILFVTNLLRAAAVLVVAALVATGVTGPVFYLSALVVLSLNRFVLATLSASLPHVVRPQLLVGANAVTTTSGTIAAVVGAGVGFVVREIAGADDAGSAAVLVTAALLYLLATAAASTMPSTMLGPDRPRRVPLRHAVHEVWRGLITALHHLRSRPSATRALGAMTAQRVAFGFATVSAIVLCRNYFQDSDDVDAGLRGLAFVVVASGIGVLIGAMLTPTATRRRGFRRWVTACFVASAVVQVVFGLPYTLPMLVIGAALLATLAQSTRICVDTIVQRSVDDRYRGRVFALYDVLFNAAFVASAALAALVLPPDGYAPVAVVVIATGYLAIAAWWWRSTRADPVISRSTPAGPTTTSATPPSPPPR